MIQLSAAKVAAAWGPQTRGVLLASPSNPTGTSIDPVELARIIDVVRSHGGITLIDEIYLGLSHDDQFGQSVRPDCARRNRLIPLIKIS